MKKPYAPPVFRYLDFLGDRWQQAAELPSAKFVPNDAALLLQNSQKD